MNVPRLATALVLTIASSLALADATAAQSGFALKVNSIFNRQPESSVDRIPTAAGFGLGAELVLPGGLGLGVSAYSGGPLDTVHRGASSTLFLGEANYFLSIPLIPIRPYAGVHAGLGSYRHSDLAHPDRPHVKDGLGQLGYQWGVRIPIGKRIGIDGQMRRVSTWLSAEQGERFSREQVLLGITLF